MTFNFIIKKRNIQDMVKNYHEVVTKNYLTCYQGQHVSRKILDTSIQGDKNCFSPKCTSQQSVMGENDKSELNFTKL